MPERTVTVAAGAVALEGTLQMPDHATGLVVFAHGSGSSRHSPRNRFVADRLVEAGLATLLFDLLTPDEDLIDQRTRELRFDVDLLSARTADAVRWAGDQDDLAALPVGCFGASTGAAAALAAAAELPGRIAAVVSRGGRPDLAGDALPRVQAPTLLIVGGRDHQVIDLNRQAQQRMAADTRIEIIDGATHLFEEPGALEQVADLAATWFARYLHSKPIASS